MNSLEFYFASVADHFEHLFIIPFAWHGFSKEDAETAQSFGILPRDYAIGLGLNEGYRSHKLEGG
jgi:hypothetical protein